MRHVHRLWLEIKLSLMSWAEKLTEQAESVIY